MASSRKPPKTRGIRLRIGWPPVEIIETHETRWSHGLMAIVTAVAAIGLAHPLTFEGAFSILSALVSGWAMHAWVIHEDYYEVVEEADDE